MKNMKFLSVNTPKIIENILDLLLYIQKHHLIGAHGLFYRSNI